MVVFGLLVLGARGAAGDALAEQGRAVFERYRPAVVTVKVVVSISAGGESQENEGWANGTIVDARGLTVLALSFLDPTDIYQKLGDRDGGTSVRVASLRMILDEGRELAAEVVLRDKDLDIALIRPIAPPAEPLPFVAVGENAVPQLLEPVAIITQLGEVARRAHSVSIERIETVVEKPMRYFMVGDHKASAVLSAPVFTLDGKLVGVGAMRAITSSQGGGFGENVLVVIVPAATILESIAQVPPAGAPVAPADSPAP